MSGRPVSQAAVELAGAAVAVAVETGSSLGGGQEAWPFAVVAAAIACFLCLHAVSLLVAADAGSDTGGEAANEEEDSL